jgi:hypothetical protein
MRWLFLMAGLLCMVMVGVHAVMGGIDTLNPMMAGTLDMEVRVVLMAVWHGVTVLLVLCTVAFFWAFRAGSEKARSVGILLGMFYVLFAGVFAGLSLVWFEDPMILPQWTLLAPIGLFSLVASF